MKGKTSVNNEKYDSYLELARLVNANISGPTKCMLVEKAKERMLQELSKESVKSFPEN